ncbi:MAG: hypothetical protein LJU34_03060 [Oscillospiraceae bacterium]|nr:hypothetical protein [Oscillospiraceae bacterium]
MIRLRNIALPLDGDEAALEAAAARALGCKVKSLSVVRRAVDARKKSDVHFVYTLDVSVKNETSALARCRDAAPAPEGIWQPPAFSGNRDSRPVVVGFGPGGMFAALVLAMAGLRPIVLERGEAAEARTETVARMRKSGRLDPESNIQFGEGGAGAFSDGKLSSGVKDRRIPWVLAQLVEAGAPADILTDAKPHIGTDLLPGVCAGIRRRIISLGGEVRFSTKVTGLTAENGRLTGAETNQGLVPCEALILACGHSARDTFEILCKLGIPLSPKPFAMGVRIEHLQREIDKAQYGPFAGHPKLSAADYSLACQLPNGRRCYTFCMCPGGEVVPAASEEGRVCTNGASPSGRNYVNANAALLAAVAPADFPYPGVLGGMEWQRAIEQAAYDAAGGGFLAPCQTVGSFLTGHAAPFGAVSPSYAPGVRALNLHSILPACVGDTIAGALPVFDRKLRGFAAEAAVLTGPETRSSSPVRMERGDDMQSPALRGLYPCGEGAGWAGGIMSAAVDGIRCAQALLESLSGDA